MKGVPADGASRVISQSKVIAMLALLALAPSASFTRRDRLAGLLWPELDQQHARTALRKAIHFARSVLGDEVITNRGDEELVLSASALWCDVVDMRASIEQGRLQRAVDLYRGDLMPGFFLPECHDFDAWLEGQRAALLEEVVAASWALAKHLESDNKGTDAAAYAKKVARLAWSNERVLRRSLEMLVRLGDRAGALRAYDEFARKLRRELEADPSPETVRLVEVLRTGSLPA